MKNQKGLGLIGVLLILGALLLTAGGAVVWEKKVSPTPAPKPLPTIIVSKLTPPSTIFLTTSPILGKDVSFQTIKSWVHRHVERANYVIRDVGGWQNLWYRMYPEETAPALPEIDFTRNMVIAALSGMRATGGYSTRIVRIVETIDKLKVSIDETSPGENCVLTMAPTSPHHIVKVARIEKEVEFISEHKVRNCE